LSIKTQGESVMAIIRNLTHIGLRVKNLDASIAFYCDALGFEEVFTMKKRVLYDMLAAGGDPVPDRSDEDSTWLAYLRIHNEQYMELFPVPDEEVAQFTDRQSFFHYSLQCDDIVATVNKIRERGVTVSSLHVDALADRPVPNTFVPVTAPCHSLIAWLKDPDGNLIELMQLVPDSMQRGKDRPE
jgi:lactoylglutathione lyase